MVENEWKYNLFKLERPLSDYNDITLKKLTKDCHDDDNKVNNVPAILEVVLSERNDLQNDLYQEDDDEDEVYPV